MRGRIVSTQAIVLRAVDYREADRVVTLLTDRLGKITAMARAARRSRKRFAGALEPFSVVNAEMHLGRGELVSLDGARILQVFPRLLRDLEKMTVAGAAVELVRLATPERQPDPPLFAATVAMFQLLEHIDEGLQEALTCFRVRAMTLLGFAPRFDACGRCGRPPAQKRAALFDPLAGHLVCRACGGAADYLSASTRRRLMLASGPDWIDAVKVWPEKELSQARKSVTSFVEHRLERRLETR